MDQILESNPSTPSSNSEMEIDQSPVTVQPLNPTTVSSLPPNSETRIPKKTVSPPLNALVQQNPNPEPTPISVSIAPDTTDTPPKTRTSTPPVPTDEISTFVDPANSEDSPSQFVAQAEVAPVSPTFVVTIADIAPAVSTPKPSEAIQVIIGVTGKPKETQFFTSQILRNPPVHRSYLPPVNHALPVDHTLPLPNHYTHTPPKSAQIERLAMVNRTRISEGGKMERLSLAEEWKTVAKFGKPTPLNKIRFKTPPCPIPPFLAVSLDSLSTSIHNSAPAVSQIASISPHLIIVPAIANPLPSSGYFFPSPPPFSSHKHY
ncbi:hypothetical protein niasHS_013793 [Heterodera schachtii]|uniref:Uncharacterized protein n=1 Tax=Heterodera schachtii TaxID=97005 RepID=A0ABD2ILH3_HETSC